MLSLLLACGPNTRKILDYQKVNEVILKNTKFSKGTGMLFAKRLGLI